MLLKVKHSKSLPSHVSPHQMATVSRKIHDRVKDAVVPLVDANPQYYAVVLTLEQLDDAVIQLKTALDQRKFKKATSLRGVGGADGLNGDASVTDEQTLSAVKRRAYRKRQAVMKRFRFVLEWKLQDAIEVDDTDLHAAARTVGKALSRRIDDFERSSYEESEQEFDLFFDSLDRDQAALDALPVLDLTKVYDDLKSAHSSYQAVYNEQTQLDANLEELPKVTEATANLRRVVRALLNMLHLDVGTGNQTLNPVLGHVDEMIDKVRAVGKRRHTLDQKAKAKAQASGNAASGNGASSSDASGNSASGDTASDSNASDNGTSDSANASDASSPSGSSDATDSSSVTSSADASDAADAGTASEANTAEDTSPADASDQAAESTEAPATSSTPNGTSSPAGSTG